MGSIQQREAHYRKPVLGPRVVELRVNPVVVRDRHVVDAAELLKVHALEREERRHGGGGADRDHSAVGIGQHWCIQAGGGEVSRGQVAWAGANIWRQERPGERVRLPNPER